MTMTVYDMCFLYLEENEEMSIWNLDDGKTVFQGTFGEAMQSEFRCEEVQSFDIEDGKIVLNI